MPVPVAAADADPVQFLRVAAQGAGVSTHADLWRWLRGDVQVLLPHELLIAAWGDFTTGAVQLDLVSSLPGLRTHQVRADRLVGLVRTLRDRWVAARHGPCEVDVHAGVPSDPALGCMRTALVHGTRDAWSGSERIFAFLSWRERCAEREAQALRLLMPFMDTALRRLAPLPSASSPYAGCQPPGAMRAGVAALVPATGSLSERERQIMSWVAMGKTNPEIGCILRISEFTVKNHMKSIFGKLDVSNRAQAVAKLTRIATPA